MASRTLVVDQFKLDVIFHDDTVTHTGLLAGPRANATWKRGTKIGSGGFGVVWIEKKVGSGELRAVKVIPRRALSQELQTLVRLQDHPRLFVRLFGWFEDPLSTYIAMEYIAHGDLSQYIRGHGAKAAAEARVITSQILDGLVVLHERKITHRNLTPYNILIASPSPIWIKIAGFGIAEQSVGTSLRTICGTSGYLAPEILGFFPRTMGTGTVYTNAVDLWALGIVLHEMLTAEIPFRESQEEYSNFSSEILIDVSRTIDIDFLYNYCEGTNPFASEKLQQQGVSTEGVGFVQSLLAPNPRDRVTAADALKNLWLMRPEKHASSASQTGHTLLHRAATSGHLNAINLLLDMGADVDGTSASQNSQTALHAAAAGGRLDVMKVLVDRGANTNTSAASQNSQSALHAAAEGGHLSAVYLLLDMGANVDGVSASENGQSALHSAASAGNLDMMKLLLDRGANVHGASASQNGQTALHAAAGGGRIDAINLLLDRGASVNKSSNSQNSQSALHAAAEGGHLNAIKLLLDRGADVNGMSANQNARSALHAAVANGHLDATKLLLARGARVNRQTWSAVQDSVILTLLEAHIESKSRRI